MEARRSAGLGRAWEDRAQAQTSLSAYRRSCWVPDDCTEPACLPLYYPVYSGSAENPLPLPPPPQSRCEHVEGLTANTQCLHTLGEATQQNTYTNTANRRTQHSEYSSHNHAVSHARHTNTWCLFSLHSRRALCPLPSALSSYQVALVSSEATDVPIPLFPGLASQACKMPASNPLPEYP